MLEAIEAVQGYVAGLDKGTFCAERRTVDAVVRNLEVLGEAAKGVPPGERSSQCL
jgi:uncharacterized protein with HEPN domain